MQPVLPSDEQRLADVLAERDRRFGCRLADMYLGALRAARDTGNGDRFAQASHGVRELLEKLPLYHDSAPVFAPTSTAKSHLDRVAAELDRAQTESLSYDGLAKTWSGPIDPHVVRFFVEIDVVVVAHRSSPSKRERNRRFMRHLDPIGPLPVDKENQYLKEWNEHDSFFLAVSHHNKYPEAAEFEARLSGCTSFLLGRLANATVETLQALDDIIEEAQGHA